MTKLERLLSYEEGTEVKLSNSGKNLITQVVTAGLVHRDWSNTVVTEFTQPVVRHELQPGLPPLVLLGKGNLS